MLQNFAKAWRNNRGNLLLTSGIIAGILMCLVWYLDLVPDVRFVGRNVTGTQVSTSQRSDQSPLVVTLRIPMQATAVEEMPLIDLRFVVELHLASETWQPEQIPLFSRSTTLRNDGKPQAVVFGDVQPGMYAVLAYIDLNNNEKFDCDESMQPLEPFRLSRGNPSKESSSEDTGVKGSDSQAPPQPFNLEQAGVEVVSSEVTLIEFDFRLSANP
jgi:hypothetical protein